jgi:hypothetical protein
MMMAMTSSTHMIAPRLKKTKPSSQSMISIAATTKRKSSKPIQKTSLTFNLAAYFKMCDWAQTTTTSSISFISNFRREIDRF